MTGEHLHDDCGCTPTGSATPAPVRNTPGRPAVDRRVGTSSQFAAQMAAELTRRPHLETFTNRRSDDPAMALVDAWSAVLDVLSFYNERTSNESYLRTAVDPRSVTELALSVGYAPGRGRASATSLAFTLEDGLGAPVLVPIAAGTKVASLPAPGEVPQNYETGTAFDARPPWNAMPARTRIVQEIRTGARQAYVEGLRTDVAVGDAVLLVGREREGAGSSQYWAFRRLSSVHLEPDLVATRIAWVEPLGSPAKSSGREKDEKVPDPRDLRIFVLRRKAGIFGAAAPDYRLINESAGGGRPDPKAITTARDTGKKDLLGPVIKDHVTHFVTIGPDWPDFSVNAPHQPENTVDLDSTYPDAAPGSWAVLTRDGVTVCYRILTAVEVSRTDFTLNAKVSRLSLQGPTVTHLFGQHVRETTVWVGSELVPLATSPDERPVQGLEVELARPVPTLEAGRTVVVRGPRPVVRVAEGVRTLQLKKPAQPLVDLHPGDELEIVGPAVANPDGSTTWTTADGSVTAPSGAVETVAPAGDAVIRSEVAVIAGPTPDDPEVATLRFAAPLAGCYDRQAVRILGNVATATHGETKTQVLGSGNASAAYQRFKLAGAPLTYVLQGSGGAVVSTLDVKVDGRSWREVPRLFGTGPHDEVFTTRSDDGQVTVQFGDGLTGARIPTGTNNVTATYRVGTGVSGRVAADQLTLPMTRPLGLRSVTNPLASGLAADPEPADAVRANAPRTALTLERVVSLRDVEEFARAVPGIGKAVATRLWKGRSHLLHLTVAGTAGQTVDPQAIADLGSALLAAGDERLRLTVDAAEIVPVHVEVGVVVDPAYDAQTVLDGVRASVTAALAVDARELAQPLTNGDIILASHAVRGVLAVTVLLPETDVASSAARMSSGQPRPAQLVVLAPGGLKVSEASA